VKAICIG